MSIPSLENGLLPAGVHDTSVSEVIATFGNNSDVRSDLARALLKALTSAVENGATSVFLAGSFVSAKQLPNDLDLLVVHANKSTIPTSVQAEIDSDAFVDIQYASEDEPVILSSFMQFLRRQRNGYTVAILRIAQGSLAFDPDLLPPPSQSTIQAIIASYGSRRAINSRVKKGLLVTVHGIRTHAPWNAVVSRLASSQGWVVAPYVHGYTSFPKLYMKSARAKKVDAFRHWLDAVVNEQRLPVSIIAHSFGTYVVAKYLTAFPYTHPINSLILTGCILSDRFDWNSVQDRVGHVLHERAPNEFAVTTMRRTS